MARKRGVNPELTLDQFFVTCWGLGRRASLAELRAMKRGPLKGAPRKMPAVILAKISSWVDEDGLARSLRVYLDHMLRYVHLSDDVWREWVNLWQGHPRKQQ